MVIGRGAASDAKYLSIPKIGSPDVAGDLSNASIPSSGARSLTMEDIELVTGIKTERDRRDVVEYGTTAIGEQDWYNNEFLPNFMNIEKPNPTSNIKMPTLSQGIITDKPLYTYYWILNTYPNILDSLRTHIFKPDFYWMAGRYVGSNLDYSSFSVRNVGSEGVGGSTLCDGSLDSLEGDDILGLVRPVVCLQSGVQLTEYIENGYNWKVNQN